MPFRMSVLHIDADTDLPLLYGFEQTSNAFHTVGYVRCGPVTVWDEVRAPGPDTPRARDAFLCTVLVRLGIPADRAVRIVGAADHLADGAPGGERPSLGVSDPPVPGRWADGPERDGARFAGPGILLGLVAGILVGRWLGGWYGASIGAFVGASTSGDLVVGGWQLVHVHSPRNWVEVHDTVALLLVALASIAVGLAGWWLAGTGFWRGAAVFVGMSIGALVLAVLATRRGDPRRARGRGAVAGADAAGFAAVGGAAQRTRQRAAHRVPGPPRLADRPPGPGRVDGAAARVGTGGAGGGGRRRHRRGRARHAVEQSEHCRP